MEIVTIQAVLPEGEELVVSTKAKVNMKEVGPAYICFGFNPEFKTQEAGFEQLTNMFATVGQAATWLFWQFIPNLNRQTNEVKYKPANKAEKQIMIKGYRKLHKANAVLRLQRELYFINPRLILPKLGYYCLNRDRWDTLKLGGK